MVSTQLKARLIETNRFRWLGFTVVIVRVRLLLLGFVDLFGHDQARCKSNAFVFHLTLVLFVSRNRFGRQEADLSRNSFDLQGCTRLLPTTKRKLGFGRFEGCQSGIGIVVD